MQQIPLQIIDAQLENFQDEQKEVNQEEKKLRHTWFASRLNPLSTAKEYHRLIINDLLKEVRSGKE